MLFKDLPVEVQEEFFNQSDILQKKYDEVAELLNCDGRDVPLNLVCQRFVDINNCLFHILETNVNIANLILPFIEEEFDEQQAQQSQQNN